MKINKYVIVSSIILGMLLLMGFATVILATIAGEFNIFATIFTTILFLYFSYLSFNLIKEIDNKMKLNSMKSIYYNLTAKEAVNNLTAMNERTMHERAMKDSEE